MSTIEPFGTSESQAQPDLASIKAFGCTVIDFNVSADWSSQAGSLSMRLIEDESDGDRLRIPVLGSPHLFELKNTSGEVLFQYVGIVDSFSRSSSNSKTYSANLTSPLVVLDSAKVIMDKYAGLGGSLEGHPAFNGMAIYDFGSRNSNINVLEQAGIDHWFNVSNLINVYGILENDDPYYRVPFNNAGTLFSDFGFSANSADGIPLVKLMWALHMGINHLPRISGLQKQRTHGGNLLFGRHNYDVVSDSEGVPFYYHFDALGFYNQVVGFLDPQFRIGGDNKSIKEIISEICQEANLEFYCYIDIYTDTSIGDETLQELDPNWSIAANCSWPLSTAKFTNNGHYGGTIRVQTLNKNAFFNASRPFSNIAYRLIGFETPDLNAWSTSSGVHPGKRPGDSSYGQGNASTYSDPLDSQGLDTVSDGFTDVGTRTLAQGGTFPVTEDIYTLDNLARLKSSDISLKLNDYVTMKVVVGGNITRLITVPRKYIKQYWGDIILTGSDPRETANTATDSLGLNETSTRKVPVVTPLLDPKDIDDYILIDMRELFGDLTISGVLQGGVYAASLMEIRIAMTSQTGWNKWLKTFKYSKYRNLLDYFYPNRKKPYNRPLGYNVDSNADKEVNDAGGLGYVGVMESLNLGNDLTSQETRTAVESLEEDGTESPDNALKAGQNLSINITTALAESQLNKYILSGMYEKVKTIGDTHYGKSWYLPTPYIRTIEDLNGENLVGNFKRSWELIDSAYVEPSNYYGLKIPQSNQFIQDGKVSAFVNYDHNFVTGGPSNTFDEQYAAELKSPINGLSANVFNFSEYDLDTIAITRYGSNSILHASPESIDDKYSFLPYAYERLYDRSLLPFSDIKTGTRKHYKKIKNEGLAPTSAGQQGYEESTGEDADSNENTTEAADQPSGPPGSYSYASVSVKIPSQTLPSWLSTVVNGIASLDYKDNGRFCLPFIKVTTSRVMLPKQKGTLGKYDPSDFIKFCGLGSSNKQSQAGINALLGGLNPFPVCVCPYSVSYPQMSNRHVYGPWITNLNNITFRGRIEYEQDDSLVPENFLIPTNFGQFGGYSLSQTSGFAGLNLAAQARANAIENFALFAVEEGSFTIPGAPSIKRIGDSLYGIQQITDVRINVSVDQIETTYSFKTISPRFGKNTRDLEKNLTRISNKLKKIKLR